MFRYVSDVQVVDKLEMCGKPGLNIVTRYNNNTFDTEDNGH